MSHKQFLHSERHFLIVHHILPLTGRQQEREEGGFHLCVGQLCTPLTAPCLSALQLPCSLLLQSRRSSAGADPHRVILPSAGSNPDRGFLVTATHSWHTNLNCHCFHFALISKAADDTAEEQVGSTPSCLGGLLWQGAELRRTAMCNCLANAQHESCRHVNHRLYSLLAAAPRQPHTLQLPERSSSSLRTSRHCS